MVPLVYQFSREAEQDVKFQMFWTCVFIFDPINSLERIRRNGVSVLCSHFGGCLERIVSSMESKHLPPMESRHGENKESWRGWKGVRVSEREHSIPPERRKLMSTADLPGGRETVLQTYLFLNSKTANENFS